MVRPERDHVHPDVGLAGELEHLLVVDDGRRVLAVREQHDGAPPRRVRGALAAHLLERDVEGGVERGRSRGAGLANRRFEGDVVRGEVLQHRVPVVELDDLAEIRRAPGS